jgi:hypothetical protein
MHGSPCQQKSASKSFYRQYAKTSRITPELGVTVGFSALHSNGKKSQAAYLRA